MEADLTKRNALIAGLGVLSLIAFSAVSAATGIFAPVGQWFHNAATTTIPINDPQYMYTRALEYQQDGNPTYAAAAARRAIIIEPGYAPARKFLAAKDLKDQNYADAALQCKGLLIHDPNDSTALLGLASAYTGLGESEKSEQLYRQVVESTITNEIARDAAKRSLAAMGKPIPQGAPPSPSQAPSL